MKIISILIFLIVFISCKKTSINTIKNNIEFKLPGGYKILKDTTFYNNDLKVQVDLQFTQNEIPYLIKKFKIIRRFDLVKNEKGYELSFIAKEFGQIIQIKIDTIESILKYREYHN